jgi:ribosome-associated toxin RatA of RatAB toxin-antitoxin module
VPPQPLRLLACLLCALPAAAGAAEDVVVEAERRGRSVSVRANAVLFAPVTVAWQVLTDYERLPAFIPGIAKSSVRAREGNRLLVEQAGAARFLIFSFPIEVRLEVVESPPHAVSSRALGGNLRRMDGRYELAPDAVRGAVTLRYNGEIEPEFTLPPVIGLAALRHMVEEQFTALVAEIERRAAAAAPK